MAADDRYPDIFPLHCRPLLLYNNLVRTLETYRRGHNGAHSKCVWRVSATRVRIPPSPLLQTFPGFPEKVFYTAFSLLSFSISSSFNALAMVFAAFIFDSLCRCAYRLAVVLKSLCPSHSCICFILTPQSRRRLAQLCPYGIITTNRKSPIYQGLEGFPSAFLSFSKMKKKLTKVVKIRGCYVSDKN